MGCWGHSGSREGGQEGTTQLSSEPRKQGQISPDTTRQSPRVSPREAASLSPEQPPGPTVPSGYCALGRSLAVLGLWGPTGLGLNVGRGQARNLLCLGFLICKWVQEWPSLGGGHSRLLGYLDRSPGQSFLVGSECPSATALRGKASQTQRESVPAELPVVSAGGEKNRSRASMVAQWLRIRLPMQGTRVQALVREDPTCCGAAKPVGHNY